MATQSYESHNKKVIQRAQPVDLLEFHRSWYNHWAVYIGKYTTWDSRLSYYGIYSKIRKKSIIFYMCDFYSMNELFEWKNLICKE